MNQYFEESVNFTNLTENEDHMDDIQLQLFFACYVIFHDFLSAPNFSKKSETLSICQMV